jgi:membrane associated rhomboid family serine protease/Flp pilus assembly protein TadD
LANCRQCGVELPSFTFGDASPYCKTCRAHLPPEPKPAAIDALPVEAAPASRTPATYVLLAINIAVFGAMVASGISAFEPTTHQMLHWGADFGPLTLNGQYWRMLTSMFLHFGIIHLLGNMWCLWSLGQLAEKFVGSIAVIAIYLLTGIGASLLSLSWNPMRVSAGASGAIFGIAGLLVPVLYYGKLNLPKEEVRHLLGYVVRFSFLNLLFGLKAHVDNMAHLGGLVSGLLIGFFLARTFNSPAGEQGAQRRNILAVSAMVLLVLFVPVAMAKQYAVEFGKGDAAFAQKDYNAAIEHMQKYLAAQPDDDYGHAILAASFQATKRFDDAVREYERGLAINPDYSYIQVNLATIYLFQHKPEKAVPLFSKLSRSPDVDGTTMYSYGEALLETGDLPAAEQALRKSLELDSKLIEAHQLLSEVLQKEGKIAEARAERHSVDLLEENQSPSTGAHTDPH